MVRFGSIYSCPCRGLRKVTRPLSRRQMHRAGHGVGGERTWPVDSWNGIALLVRMRLVVDAAVNPGCVRAQSTTCSLRSTRPPEAPGVPVSTCGAAIHSTRIS